MRPQRIRAGNREPMAPENVTEPRRRNWHLWAGLFLCLIAIPTYPFVFARFPITRDIPWVNFLFFGTGLALLFCGLKRAFGQPQRYHWKDCGLDFGSPQRLGP